MSTQTLNLMLSNDFFLGMAVALVVVTVSLIVVVMSRRRVSHAGAAIAIGLLALLTAQGSAHNALVAGVGTLLVAGLVKNRLLSVAVAGVAGGLYLEVADIAWTPAAIGWILMAVVTSMTLADLDDRTTDSGIGWLLLGITWLGIFVAIPDTEQAVYLAGAGIVLITLSSISNTSRLGRPGAMALAGLSVWVISVGAGARVPAVIGGIAAFGLLIAEPVGRIVMGAHASKLTRLASTSLVGALTVGLGQLFAVIVGGRWAALQDSAGSAIALAAGTLIVAGLVFGRQ